MVFLHILSIGFALALIILADKEGFAWMRGKKELINISLTHLIHRLTWTAILVLIVTGSILTYPMREYLFQEPLFIMKLLFVSVLVFNGILIGRLMKVAENRTFDSLSKKEKLQLLASGGFSFISWAGAFILGLILFYF